MQRFPDVLFLLLAFQAGSLLAQPTVVGPYQPDSEPDGLIGANDLLSLLGLFGSVYAPDEVTVDGVPLTTAWQEECEEDEAYTDLDGAQAGAMAVLFNGEWHLLEDDALDCAVVFGCTDPVYFEFDSLAVIDDGTCTVHVDSICVSPTLDGYTYAVVEIGDQCWFAENLRTAVYANGDSIPGNLSDEEWEFTTSGAQAVYGEGSSECTSNALEFDVCDEALSVEAYGRLYNWQAVDDARGVCPSGWRVSTDSDWTQLEDHVSMQGFDGMEAAALRSTTGWLDGISTDDFGFSALPGGERRRWGEFVGGGSGGQWWTSSPADTMSAYTRIIPNFFTELSRVGQGREFGYSVRCIRDLD